LHPPMRDQWLTFSASLQQPLPLGDTPFHHRLHAKPLIKWVGSKRGMVKLLSTSIYRHLQVTHGRYIEPFLGGAAVALDLGLPAMLLSDLSAPLIDCYEWIRKNPRTVDLWLTVYKTRGTDKAAYLNQRAEIPSSKLKQAARFLYLNAVGFNGMWRVNSHGLMNVPHGHPASDAQGYSFPSLEDIMNFGEALIDTDLRCCHFSEVIKLAKSGDAIYADPPYFGVFTGYTEHGFSLQDQQQLSDMLRDASARGVAVLSTNSDAPEIREMYSWAFVTTTQEARRINCDVTKRSKVDCVLIASSSDLIVEHQND
jgi:DNA adenine methylase